MAKLAAGYNIVIKQKVGNTNTPLYPSTAVEFVFDKDGNSLATLLSGITGQNFVPDYSGETTSNLRFLRNDNTWADIQSASTSQAGVVQLTNDYSVVSGEPSQTLALTQKGASDLKSAIDTALTNYVLVSQLGVSSTTGEGAVTGVATLDTNGKVPSTQLPSYVDDVIEGYLNNGAFYKTKTPGAEEGDPATYSDEVTAEGGKIYVDIDSKKTYRYAGAGAGYVEISESIVIGTTQGTAYDGAAGAALATKLDTVTEGANKVEASTTTGNILIDSVETVVVPEATDSVDGYITAAEHQKLGYCMETAVSATASAPTFTNGLWFETLEAYAPNA